MARHASDNNEFALAGWVWAVLVVTILTALAGSVWFLTNTSEPSVPSASPSSHMATSTAASSRHITAASSTPSASISVSSAAPTPISEPESTSEPTSAASAPIAVADTLLLLDTSAELGPHFSPVTQALGNTARQIYSRGHLVALWNYSSPISATATVGYRDNIGFGEAEPVAFALTQFGTAGVPQTRSAILAALNNARQHAELSGTARVLVLTTGTQQDIDDATFISALEQIRKQGVYFSVVHIGQGPIDELVKARADTFITADPQNQAALEKALSQAAGL